MCACLTPDSEADLPLEVPWRKSGDVADVRCLIGLPCVHNQQRWVFDRIGTCEAHSARKARKLYTDTHAKGSGEGDTELEYVLFFLHKVCVQAPWRPSVMCLVMICSLTPLLFSEDQVTCITLTPSCGLNSHGSRVSSSVKDRSARDGGGWMNSPNTRAGRFPECVHVAWRERRQHRRQMCKTSFIYVGVRTGWG